MKWVLLGGLALLTGCVNTPRATTDYFARQAEFAADRERETLVIEQLDYEEACAQVTAVLMDMDCNLVEINSELGVISARPTFRPMQWSRGALIPPRSCSGHQVTVSVVQRPHGAIAIRSSFTPPATSADETFRQLLRTSISLHTGGGAGP